VISWFELLCGGLCVAVALNAARRGFLREGSLLLGLAAAIWLAGQWYRPLGALLLRSQERSEPWAALALYVGLTLVLLVVLLGLSSLAAPLVRRGPFQRLDRAAGLLVGLGEAGFAIGLLALTGERLGLFRPLPGSWISRSAEAVSTGVVWLSAAVPVDVARALVGR
jgi:uncharacterized membrane protein required for colicin V production